MATSAFNDLKKSREAMFEALNEQANKAVSGNRPPKDDRIWYPGVDDAGNGYAEFRFLPPSNGETVPYVREWSHGFKCRNKWYIEKSLTTLGLPDPVSEHNQVLWATDDKELQKIVSSRKRTLSYWANVYVVRDPKNPENEGLVKLFRFGKQIFEMIEAKRKPLFPGEEPINVFDFWEGANFVMKIRTKDAKQGQKGFRDYTSSGFKETAGPLATDAQMEAIWKKQYLLQSLIAPDQFDTYENLVKKFQTVTGETVGEVPAGYGTPPTSAPRQTRQREDTRVPWNTDDDDTAEAVVDGDDELAEFKRLAGR
jgi:hypothetical protein